MARRDLDDKLRAVEVVLGADFVDEMARALEQYSLTPAEYLRLCAVMVMHRRDGWRAQTVSEALEHKKTKFITAFDRKITRVTDAAGRDQVHNAFLRRDIPVMGA